MFFSAVNFKAYFSKIPGDFVINILISVIIVLIQINESSRITENFT